MFSKAYNKLFYGMSAVTFVALVGFNQPIGESFRASLIPLMFPLGQYLNGLVRKQPSVKF